MEAVRTSETSVDNHFTRQYNPEDSSEQLWGYKVEEKLYLGVREQKNVEYHWFRAPT
jgi:hypothetical protein